MDSTSDIKKRRRTARLVLLFALPLAGCTYAVPMNTVVPDFGIPNKVPLRATILIPERVHNYVVKGNPHGYGASVQTFEFPLGAELEKASLQAFGQVFQQVHVVRRRPRPNEVEVLVEPEITSFQFWFDFIGPAVSKIRLKVTITDGTVRVLTRETESPEERSMLGIFGFDLGIPQGDAASKALVSALREIASEATRSPELWKLAEKVRMAK